MGGFGQKSSDFDSDEFSSFSSFFFLYFFFPTPI